MVFDPPPNYQEGRPILVPGSNQKIFQVHGNRTPYGNNLTFMCWLAETGNHALLLLLDPDHLLIYLRDRPRRMLNDSVYPVAAVFHVFHRRKYVGIRF